ncbi:MAG: YhbY family RNA-binding protein [Nitrospinae bacterium]|nr:YhbY family RNA-binding protein [Nitrospinota bacterium]
MTKITSAQRKTLKGLAHHIDPVVQLGKNGLTSELIETINKSLDDHELIKLKFIDFKDEKKELAAEIEKKTKSVNVSNIGNISIYYRQQKNPEKRKIKV